jgi:hypothetical protein
VVFSAICWNLPCVCARAVRALRWHTACSEAAVTSEELSHRTSSYVHRVRRFMQPLLTHRSAAHAAAHAGRAVTNVADHYRAACLARSDAEFGARMEGTLDQLEETTFWLELLRLTDEAPADAINPLIADGRDLAALLRGETAAPKR